MPSSLILSSEPKPSRIFSVSGLTQLIKQHLEARFGEVWVEGEISNLKIPSSGHAYFTLKDEKAQLRCVIFRWSSRKLRFDPKDGQKVLCHGRTTVYEPRGDYQLVADTLEPRGVGALQLAFEQLKERLQKEGLFEVSHKKSLPILPRRIGIVTSSTGAAIRDILKVLQRRFANLAVLINPVRVQGEGSAEVIAAAIDELNATQDIDVIIVSRGGGSLEDLWAFNEEVVARAIFRSDIPVISAVGHEVDYTIADFVSDLRAPTPSAAAEMVVRTKREMREEIESGVDRLHRGFLQRIGRFRDRLELHRKVLRDPRRLVETLFLRIDELNGRLYRGLVNTVQSCSDRVRHASENLRHRNPRERVIVLSTRVEDRLKRLGLHMGFYLKQKRDRLQLQMAALDNLSPLNILNRGYSITRILPEMSLLKEARSVEKGAAVHVRLHKGSLICHVEKIRE